MGIRKYKNRSGYQHRLADLNNLQAQVAELNEDLKEATAALDFYVEMWRKQKERINRLNKIIDALLKNK